MDIHCQESAWWLSVDGSVTFEFPEGPFKWASFRKCLLCDCMKSQTVVCLFDLFQHLCCKTKPANINHIVTWVLPTASVSNEPQQQGSLDWIPNENRWSPNRLNTKLGSPGFLAEVILIWLWVKTLGPRWHLQIVGSWIVTPQKKLW